MKKNKKPLLFRILRWLIRLVFIKFTVSGYDKQKGAANIIIANHAQIFGPLSIYYYLPEDKKMWIVGQMCVRKEVTPYAMEDFWRYKSKWIKWLYYLASVTLLAPIGSYLMRHADTIPVYKDIRLKKTMQSTVEAMDSSTIVIFPESRDPHNRFVNAFHDRFVDIAKQFVRQQEKDVYFHPAYVCPEFRKTIFGKPIRFDKDAPIKEERIRVIALLQQKITELGESLPQHTIVPYVNIKKKDRSKSKEGTQ